MELNFRKKETRILLVLTIALAIFVFRLDLIRAEKWPRIKLNQKVESTLEAYTLAQQLCNSMEKNAIAFEADYQIRPIGGRLSPFEINFVFTPLDFKDKVCAAVIKNDSLIAEVSSIGEGLDRRVWQERIERGKLFSEAKDIKIDILEAIGISELNAGFEFRNHIPEEDIKVVALMTKEQGRSLWKFTYDAWGNDGPIGVLMVSIDATSGDVLAINKNMANPVSE